MCTFLKGDYERYKVKKEKQLADGGHMGRIIGPAYRKNNF